MTEAKIIKEIDTETARIYMREDGIVVNIDKPLRKTVDNIQSMLDAYATLADGQRRAFLIDPSVMKGLDSKARKKALPVIKEHMSCFVVVNKNPLARIILNFLTKVDGLNIPHKMVKDYESGIAWLKANSEDHL